MKWSKSIRVRFAVWTASLFLVLLIVFSVFVYISLSTSLYGSVDSTLTVSAVQVENYLNDENGQLILAEPLDEEDSGLPSLSEQGLTIIVMTEDGSVLQSVGPFRGAALTKDKIPEIDQKGIFLTLNNQNGAEGDRIRLFIHPVSDDGRVIGWVQIIQSLGQVENTLKGLITALAISGAGLLFFAGLGGYMISSRVLKPIFYITQTAQQIADREDLTARLNLPDSGEEVNQLASTFDTMIESLDDTFRRERQFVADASHELRTPLAAMQAILSFANKGDRTEVEYQQAFKDLSEETDRMRGLIEDLLQLARGEYGFYLQLEHLDMSFLLENVVDSLRPLAEAKGLDLSCNIPPSLPFQGDLDALIRLFVNLLDNAIKYTVSGSIVLSASMKDNELIVNVTDTGIGISPEHIPHIFDRFYRVDASRSSRGYGLGLPIAMEIAGAHRGKIEVTSMRDHGTSFIVRLPTSIKFD